jgi:hypothetical protein
MTWDELLTNCRDPRGYMVPLSEFRTIVPTAVKQAKKNERDQLQFALGDQFSVTDAEGHLRVTPKKPRHVF